MKQNSSSKPEAVSTPRVRRGYGGRTADELALERRQRLLDTGLELFSSRGYNRSPIELICTTAGVTARHFYELFDSREALLLAVYEAVINHAYAQLQDALKQGEATPPERLRRAVRAFVHAYMDDRRRARIACIEVVGVSAVMAQRRSEIINQFALVIERYIDSLVSAGQLPRRNYHLGSVAMVGAGNELMAKWLVEADLPIQTLIEELQLMFEALLLGFRLIGNTQPASGAP